jgi:putative protease
MRSNSDKKRELLAPAGNLTKAKTALAFGADALYVGTPSFSLRCRINDFDTRKIGSIIDYAHARERKVYVTVNIFAHNRHLAKLKTHIKKLKRLGADGLIVSDPGVLEVVREQWSEAEVHLSTQANCTNWQAARFWQQQGVKRIILGREVSLNEIREISKRAPGVELEYFVHGAMCMAYSGRCFLSQYFRGRSANLGDCAHPCRWSYHLQESRSPGSGLEIVEDKNGSYILNSQDLCLIKYLGELSKAGVSSFKIEGRTKSVYYVATAVGAYRRAIDILTDRNMGVARQKQEWDFLYKELKNKLVNRGYSTGFLLGDKGQQNTEQAARKSEWRFCGEVLGSDKMPSGEYRVNIKVHNDIRSGDELEILRPPYDIIKVRPRKIWNAKTGEEMKEAHGGGSQHVIYINCKEEIPEFSIIRKCIK